MSKEIDWSKWDLDEPIPVIVTERARVGHPVSEETKAKISASMKERLKDPVERAKLDRARDARTWGPEWRAKVSAANTGKTHTEETKAKMSAAKMGSLSPRWKGAAVCSEEGCERKAKAKGLCAKDYQRRYYAAGRPLCLDDQPQITAAPIHSLINFLKNSGATDSQIAKSLGVGARHINQLLTRETLSVYAADAIAIAWGVHPCAWWADWGNDCSEEDAA